MQLTKVLGVLALLAIASCMTRTEVPSIESLLTEAKKTFAPDKRTTVFHVHGSLKNTVLTLTGEIQSEELKQRLIQFMKEKGHSSIVDSVIVLPHPSLDGKVYGVVSTSVANMRVKPGHAEEMATQALLGTPLRILKRKDDWLFVQTPDDYLGWTDDMIALLNRKEYESWVQLPKIVVTSTYAHAYVAEDRSDIVSDLVAGNILAVRNDGGRMFDVEYPDGRRGFVGKADATALPAWIAKAKDTPEAIIATAKRFMGVPYLWGGTSAKALDCSGFTKTVFFLHGVLLPRDASQQALVGEPVSTADNYAHLEKGDLVFFGRKTEHGERVTHVGIYIDKFKFIHEGGDVRINSFNPEDADYSEFRTNMLLSARRIIGAGEDHGVRRLSSLPYFRSHEN